MNKLFYILFFNIYLTTFIFSEPQAFKCEYIPNFLNKTKLVKYAQKADTSFIQVENDGRYAIEISDSKIDVSITREMNESFIVKNSLFYIDEYYDTYQINFKNEKGFLLMMPLNSYKYLIYFFHDSYVDKALYIDYFLFEYMKTAPKEKQYKRFDNAINNLAFPSKLLDAWFETEIKKLKT